MPYLSDCSFMSRGIANNVTWCRRTRKLLYRIRTVINNVWLLPLLIVLCLFYLWRHVLNIVCTSLVEFRALVYGKCSKAGSRQGLYTTLSFYWFVFWLSFPVFEAFMECNLVCLRCYCCSLLWSSCLMWPCWHPAVCGFGESKNPTPPSFFIDLFFLMVDSDLQYFKVELRLPEGWFFISFVFEIVIWL